MKRILFFCLLLPACAGRSVAPSAKPATPAAEVAAPPVVTDTPPQEAEQLLARNEYAKALEKYREFQKDKKTSRFLMAARLGEGQSLEGLENWAEALEIYRFVYGTSIQRQPEIAAQALYRMSFCYEALGDEVKAVAALKDILAQKKYLPEEIGAAEAPARLAMLYGKADNPEESARYLDLAQKGLSQLQGRRDISPVVLAKACYQMGSISFNQISSDNFSQAVTGQRTVQRYLFKAMAFNVVPWSEQAAEKLKKNYRDLWNTLVELPGVEAVDAAALTRRRLELQTSLAGEMMALIEDAELYKPLKASRLNQQEKDFFPYLAELKKNTQNLLYQQQSKMGLTHESEKLNGLKRPGRLQNVEPIPHNKTLEDPNL